MTYGSPNHQSTIINCTGCFNIKASSVKTSSRKQDAAILEVITNCSDVGINCYLNMCAISTDLVDTYYSTSSSFRIGTTVIEVANTDYFEASTRKVSISFVNHIMVTISACKGEIAYFVVITINMACDSVDCYHIKDYHFPNNNLNWSQIVFVSC